MERAALTVGCAIVAIATIACADDSREVIIYADSAGPGLDSTDSEGRHDSDDPDAGDDGGDGDAGDPLDSITADDPSNDPTKFDVPLPMPGDEDLPAGEACGVDILFVLDNSGSMLKHNANLIAAFDGFVDEMLETLPAQTPVHVAVTRATGFYAPGNGSGWSDPSCEFVYIDGVWNPPTQVQTLTNGQQGRLFESQGQRYFEYVIGEDPADLNEWFAETMTDAIQIDVSSNTESVVAAAAYPFHPVNAEYNAGFLRDKAVLVLFLLSDAPDSAPADVPTSEFIEMVTAAKANCGPGCVLPTGIVQKSCYANPNNFNTRLMDFMGGFGAPPAAVDFFYLNQGPASYTTVFGATLAESIAYTCANLVPID